MAQYMNTANEANKKIQEILDYVWNNTELHYEVINSYKTELGTLLAQLYNLGIRTAPRAVQSTVRLNAVREACKGLPLTITIEKKIDERTGNEYNALNIQPKGE